MQATTLRTSGHGRLVVVVLGLDPEQTQDESARWRALGAVVMRTRDADGCLRVATSVRPDVIVLDRGVPQRLVQLLRAHPISTNAQIQWMPALGAGAEYRAA